MTLIINVSLLFLGVAAGLLAFFGKTIEQDQRGIQNRVTRLGWVALILMFATLALSVVKEFRNSSLAATARAEASQRESDLKGQLTRTEEKLSSAQKEIADDFAENITSNLRDENVRAEVNAIHHSLSDAGGKIRADLGVIRTAALHGKADSDLFHKTLKGATDLFLTRAKVPASLFDRQEFATLLPENVQSFQPVLLERLDETLNRLGTGPQSREAQLLAVWDLERNVLQIENTFAANVITLHRGILEKRIKLQQQKHKAGGQG